MSLISIPPRYCQNEWLKMLYHRFVVPFQFLQGTVKTRNVADELANAIDFNSSKVLSKRIRNVMVIQQAARISIPPRYCQNGRIFSTRMVNSKSISIPPRYCQNLLPDAVLVALTEFQFLQGTVKTIPPHSTQAD